MQLLLTRNDTVIKLVGLKDQVTGLYVNNATVSFSLKTEPGGQTVTTGSLTYITGSQGDYRGTIESTVSLTAGSTYKLFVTTPEGFDRELTFRAKLPTS